MSTQLSLRCRCGNVRGVASDVSPGAGTRIVCYCNDCQAFGRFLGQPGVLDAAGGSDIYQMAPGRLRITQGASALGCVRLSEKGMFRWYASCCRTPIGNTLGARVPFVGVVHSFIEDPADGRSRDEVLGTPVLIFGRFATGALPPHAHATGSIGMLARALRLVLGWWITGRGRPSSFFDATTGTPRAVPQVLSATERDSLRLPAGAQSSGASASMSSPERR